MAGRYFHHANAPASSRRTAAPAIQGHFGLLAATFAREERAENHPFKIFLQLLGARIPLATSLANNLATMGSSCFGIAGFTVLTGGGSSRNKAAKTSAVESPLNGVFPVAIS